MQLLNFERKAIKGRLYPGFAVLLLEIGPLLQFIRSRWSWWAALHRLDLRDRSRLSQLTHAHELPIQAEGCIRTGRVDQYRTDSVVWMCLRKHSHDQSSERLSDEYVRTSLTLPGQRLIELERLLLHCERLGAWITPGTAGSVIRAHANKLANFLLD